MKPRLACTNCRLRKKRCDRGYPACSYCLNTHSRCLYQRQDGAAASENQSNTIPVLRVGLGASNIDSTALTASFLDHSLWRKIRHEVSLKDVTLTLDMSRCVEMISIRELLVIQTSTLGVWLPFLSSNDLTSRWSLPVTQLPGKEFLLILCLDLCTRHPDPGDPCTELYLNIKSTLASAEINGAFSMQFLQALVLVMFYEFAHGIYPAAHFTLGTCTRSMTQMGFDELRHEDSEDDWYNTEAHRRIWWAVYVLERCMAAGWPQQPMCLKEPDENTPLPCDDVSWEHRQRSPQPSLTIASQVVFSMGKFQLLAHASFLLGKAIKCVSKADHDDMEQLERTILALLNLLEITDDDGIVSVGGSRAILYMSAPLNPRNFNRTDVTSALFVLRSGEKSSTADVSHPVLRHCADYFLVRSINFLNGGLGSVNIASPFLLPWGYQVGKYFMHKSNVDGRSESIEAVRVIGQTLSTMNQRWRLSGVYVSLLHIKQEVQP